MEHIYDLWDVEKPIGLVSIPHAGEFIPEDIKPFLIGDKRPLMEDVDFRIFELIDIEALNAQGIAVISSKIHRVCIDLNRSKEVALLNWKNNSKGVKLVQTVPSDKSQEQLLTKYYDPYFNCLTELLKKMASIKQKAPVIDFHSMPSRPTAYHLKLNPNQLQNRPDFCVSHLGGTTCSGEYINFIVSYLKNEKFETLIDDPYVGGYVTKFINGFDTNNVQIETKRSLYMDETNKSLHPEQVQKLKGILTSLIVEVMKRF
ncbi:MAG: N-formylglutamate amidohydrolase [Bacteriovoracaceae bacterium]|nr:N-formylglutamate amidohydrolase [Bacteriovoracaceae bacterium]